MRNRQFVRLSQVVPNQPEGDRLTATDKGIEKLDYVKWNSKQIRIANFQFNSIEYLAGLGQFEELTGIDLSNNNVRRK